LVHAYYKYYNVCNGLVLKEVITKSLRAEDDEAQDPFLCSMALWMLKEYQTSLDTLLASHTLSSRVFNFYVFLRNHPLLVRQNKAKGTLGLSCQERNLYYFTAHAHYAHGCPTLAIHVLQQLPKIFEKPKSLSGTPIKSPAKTIDSRIESGILSLYDDDDRGSGRSKLNDSGTGTSVVDFSGPKDTKSANYFICFIGSDTFL